MAGLSSELMNIPDASQAWPTGSVGKPVEGEEPVNAMEKKRRRTPHLDSLLGRPYGEEEEGGRPMERRRCPSWLVVAAPYEKFF